MSLEASIKISVKEADIPETWITAEEANRISTSIKNEYFVDYINEIMQQINEAAAQGKTETSHYDSTINGEVYDRAVKFLKTLGYTVGVNDRKTAIFPKW